MTLEQKVEVRDRAQLEALVRLLQLGLGKFLLCLVDFDIPAAVEEFSTTFAVNFPAGGLP